MRTFATVTARLTVLPAIVVIAAATTTARVEPAGGQAAVARTSAAVRALFANPPADYSSAPFWVWNDMLTDEMIVGTLRDLSAQNIRQLIVHPRPGLMTPYLSPEWFRLWNLALTEAARLDMKLWIYDENSYPSGFAGGLVPDAMPESRQLGLVFSEQPSPSWNDDTLGVFRVSGDSAEDVSAQVKGGTSLPAGRYVAASLLRAAPGRWFGGKYYVDLLRPGVTEKFLSVTLDAYKREIGGQFGKRVPGVFTDEPQLRRAGGLPWTPALPQLFEKRWRYSLLASLPALAFPVGDWKKVRHDYYQLLLEQFIDRWARPYYDYCARNGLEFTGHYWEHEWPNAQSVPDNMALSAWQQRPGIDTLMNQYAEDAHSQFGNVRAVKEVSSVANQLGRARTLSEAYGAGGWDLRFEDMKRIGDWLSVLGINTLNQHLSYVSLRGARKRDHPQSFSYHEPWWDAYGASSAYFARMSAAISAGQQVNDILVIEPTTTAWLYNVPGKNPPYLEEIGKSFQGLLVALEKAQVEYDLGSEDVIARNGSVQGRALRVGRRDYHTVVLPPMTENITGATLDLLERFVAGGGRLISCAAAPARVEGASSDRGARLARSAGWQRAAATDLPALLVARAAPGFAIERAAGDRGVLFHHRRRLDDGELLLLVNTSIEFPSSGVVTTEAARADQWDLTSGAIRPYAFEQGTRGPRLHFDLPPAGSLLVFLASGGRASSAPTAGNGRRDAGVGAQLAPPHANEARDVPIELQPEGPPVVRRTGPNVLVLDYLDVRAGGETREKTYFYQASEFAFKKNGMDRDPWDSAVQFKDEIISRTFPPASGFEAAYRFTVRDRVPARLSVVIERPGLYAVTCNGIEVRAAKGEWWLDRAFGRIDIARVARVGENEIRLKAAPFTVYHEIEPVYVLGDFALDAADSGFTIASDRALTLAPWKEQGYPFYSEGVSYAETFVVQEKARVHRVQLKRWYGSVARVTVNGQAAGVVCSAPWTLDVTRWIHPGKNVIEVTVIGTLKNTLGPHHGDPALGSAWPANFQKGPIPGPPPGGDYSTVAYGLFDPFTLLVSERLLGIDP